MKVASKTRFVLGAMTGTSCDGMDLALLRIEGTGPNIEPHFVDGWSFSLGSLGPRLRSFAEGERLNAQELTALNLDFSQQHVDAVRSLNLSQLDLFSVHGQTVYHAPPLSWQMINLSWMAGQLETQVIGDLRGADLAKGGQGAPITPLSDSLFYGDATESRAVVNLGGFCNVTLLPKGNGRSQIQGYDLCMANQFLDFLARDMLGKPFDENGEVAMAGKSVPALKSIWLERFNSQRQQGKSLGQEDLPNESWIPENIAVADALMTACDALAQCVADDLKQSGCDRILIAGGGWRNQALRERLKVNAHCVVEVCDAFGPPSDFREAAAMALLGVMALDGEVITLPQVTRCQGKPLAGLVST
jgi:anhydro-N-acetylmuramic acid kinase